MYGETKAKTDDLRHTVDRLSSKIDKAKATSMTLKDEVKELHYYSSNRTINYSTT